MGEVPIRVCDLWEEGAARKIAGELVGAISASAGLKGGTGPLTSEGSGVVPIAAAVWNPVALRVAERVAAETGGAACVERVLAPSASRAPSERSVKRRLGTVMRAVYPPWRRDVREYVLVCLAGSVRLDHGGAADEYIFAPGYGAAQEGTPFVFADGRAADVAFLAPGQAARIRPYAPHAVWTSPDTVAVGLFAVSPGPALEAYRAAFRAGACPQFRRTPTRPRAVGSAKRRAWEKARFPGGVPAKVATKRWEKAFAKTLQPKNL